MALFNGTKRNEGSRSNTGLVKSGHASPAGMWMLDPKFKDVSMSGIFKDGVLTTYKYGGPGMEEVVIPKGRAVGMGAPVKDYQTGLYRTVITLPGLATNGDVAGIAPYNFTKDMLQEDRFGGNDPAIITQDYITLPYIPSVAANANYTVAGVLAEEQALTVDLKMPWGAVIGAGVVPNTYLKATPSGRLCLWVKGTDNPVDVVGQVLEVDFNAEPWGWMKWVLWDESARQEDDNVINRSGASNLPSDGGYPFDPAYNEGLTVFNQYQTQFVNNPTGIPGLHDGSGNYYGYGKNDTDYTNMALGTVPAGAVDNTYMVLQAKDYAGGSIKNLQEGVVVKIAGVAVAADRLTIDYTTGQITLKAMAADKGLAITATYKALHYGTPSYLDFKGVVGSVSILLKR